MQNLLRSIARTASTVCLAGGVSLGVTGCASTPHADCGAPPIPVDCAVPCEPVIPSDCAVPCEPECVAPCEPAVNDCAVPCDPHCEPQRLPIYEHHTESYPIFEQPTPPPMPAPPLAPSQGVGSGVTQGVVPPSPMVEDVPPPPMQAAPAPMTPGPTDTPMAPSRPEVETDAETTPTSDGIPQGVRIPSPPKELPLAPASLHNSDGPMPPLTNPEL